MDDQGSRHQGFPHTQCIAEAAAGDKQNPFTGRKRVRPLEGTFIPKRPCSRVHRL